MTTSSTLPRVAAGETGAVEACLERHGRLVWALARRFFRERAEAEDAVQEIFIELWKTAARFDPTKGSEEAFVATLARRRLIDRRRKQARRGEEASLSVVAEIAGSHSEDVERTTEARLAGEVLRELPETQRRAIALYTDLGMSHSEIAEATGQPLGTVKTHLRRGLAAVRNRLAGGAGTTAEGAMS
ncbi:MAG: sigma-70 family RNA polymerase sigma factor [Acidobacteriota bacterium]